MVVSQFFEPFFSFIWYNGHNITQGDSNSHLYLSPGVYRNLGGRNYDTLDVFY